MNLPGDTQIQVGAFSKNLTNMHLDLTSDVPLCTICGEGHSDEINPIIECTTVSFVAH